MGLVATLLPLPSQRQRLRQALRDQHAVVECGSWEEILQACEDQPIHLAVVDLYAGGKLDFHGVRGLKLRFPRLTAVAYVAFAVDRARDLFDAGRVGLDGLVLLDRDDSPRQFAEILERAEARGLATLVRRRITGAPPLVRDALLIAITRATERLTPASLASLLMVSRRVLGQRLAEAAFPPPQALTTWGRLIVAAHMLEDARRPADRVAAMLAFPSGSAFRNTCRRYLHATPHEIRRRGGAEHVLSLLLADVPRTSAPVADSHPLAAPGAPAPS